MSSQDSVVQRKHIDRRCIVGANRVHAVNGNCVEIYNKCQVLMLHELSWHVKMTVATNSNTQRRHGERY